MSWQSIYFLSIAGVYLIPALYLFYKYIVAYEERNYLLKRDIDLKLLRTTQYRSDKRPMFQKIKDQLNELS